MASFGEILKRERELRDISLREIADATKIHIRYLEALEANRFDSLPGGVFNKGFIRAYAAFLFSWLYASHKLLNEHNKLNKPNKRCFP